METRRTNRTRGPEDTSSDSPVGAEGGTEEAGVLPAAPPPAVQPIAASDGIQAAHACLAQLLQAAAAILEEISLGAAGGDQRTTASDRAITNPEEFALPADGSRASAGGANHGHAGNSGSQSGYTTSSEHDAAFAGPSSNAASSRL